MVFISVFARCAVAQSGRLLNKGFGHWLQFNKKTLPNMYIVKFKHKVVPVHHGPCWIKVSSSYSFSIFGILQDCHYSSAVKYYCYYCAIE